MNALPIARLFGFEIRIHVSWALILAVIAVTVTNQVGQTDPATSPLERWSIGAVVALFFLLSALAHELGHALAARRAGLPRGPVVIYFFGGAATPNLDASSPRDEIKVALAGPLVSLVIGAALMVVALIGRAVGQGPVAVAGQIAFVIGVLNLVLGAFNLLPAYPLDGGRIARGLAWARTGDAEKGLRVAAAVGRWLGMGFGGAGLLTILLVDSIDGLMLAACGWFLVSSARTAERSADVDKLLQGIHVSDVMERDVQGLPPGLTVDTFAAQILDGSTSASVPVVQGPKLLGIVGARQIRRLRRDRWAQTRAGELMVAGDRLPVLEPETTLRAALTQLHRSGMDGLPVMEAGAFAGIVTRRAVAEAIRERIHPKPVAP